VNRDGQEVAATRGVVGSVLTLLEEGATHVGVATDHIIESFRNELWPTYKTGEGVDPDLKSQFPILEEALAAAGVTVWPMVEFEADDALAAAAVMAAADPDVDQVIICTPDKDLGQCVTADGRIVQLDRRKGTVLDRAGVTEKFGVPPESIPDYLALVGDAADGFPGLPGWGAKSAAAVLARYGRLEDIPAADRDWDVAVRSAGKLAATLRERLDEALLFRRIATLELEAPVSATVEDLRWAGPTERFAELCEWLDAPRLAERANALASIRT
jgi:5'-3' exonuclease